MGKGSNWNHGKLGLGRKVRKWKIVVVWWNKVVMVECPRQCKPSGHAVNFFPAVKVQIDGKVCEGKVVHLVADASDGRLVCTIIIGSEERMAKASWVPRHSRECQIIEPTEPNRRMQLASMRFICAVVSSHSYHPLHTVSRSCRN